MERLQKFLAAAGVASRRKCEEIIAAGKVTVNGTLVTQAGVKVDPERDVVKVAGKRIRAMPEKICYLLNKPAGYISSAHDQFGRPTVLDLIAAPGRIYPVGRLDYDSEGLLLLTNDGGLAFALTHPKHIVDKHYLATVKGVPAETQLEELRRGVCLADGVTAPAFVNLEKSDGRTADLSIVIHEGKNRQVRRMCEAVGHPVLRLQRTRLAFLTLEGLAPGQYRCLTAEEMSRLRRLGSCPTADRKV
ncbi:MAG: pseudouridine synthase [bacterium]